MGEKQAGLRGEAGISNQGHCTNIVHNPSGISVFFGGGNRPLVGIPAVRHHKNWSRTVNDKNMV